jgi:hypothetical protein
MGDGLHALGGTIAKEIDRMSVEIRPVSVTVDNVGLYASYRTKCTVVDSGIYLHATCVEHGAEQGVFRQFLTPQQDRHCKQL